MAEAVRWQSWDGMGVEHMVLAERAGCLVAEGALLSGGDAHFAASYEVSCHPDGTVARAHVSVTGGPKLTLQSDGDGKWRNTDGKKLTELAGALEVDFSASPFTNTLPIRRLMLPVGGSADIVVAWVSFPTLEVHAAPQRYTRLADRHWRFRSLDADFERDIEVDEHGLVVEYPDLFSRVL